MAAILCVAGAHGRVRGEEPTWKLSETPHERSAEWLDAFASEHKGLHVIGEAEYDWPAWERAAAMALSLIGHRKTNGTAELKVREAIENLVDHASQYGQGAEGQAISTVRGHHWLVRVFIDDHAE